MAPRNPTRVDTGTRHVLAWCHECQPWRELRGTRPAALRAAADHVQLVHGEDRLAADLRERAQRIERRHAGN